MVKDIQNITQNLQDIPNVPFLINPIKKYIKKVIKESGYELGESDYSLIVNFIKNPGKRKLIFMAHTDHPGIIIKSQKSGIAMGTLEVDRLRKILTQKPVFLKIFNPDGKYIGKGNMLEIYKDDRSIKLDIDFDVPVNSFAQYDVKYFKSDDNKLEAYSLDDTISVAIMLSLLKNQFKSHYDVYLVFNLYEEVHQISAWTLAKYNILNIKKDDILINLESQKVENVDGGSYPTANYEDGPILQLSNTGCLFGYNVKGDNQSEKIVKYCAKKADIKLQIGLTKDSDDSRPFSYFPLTSNIISLNIPNKYKHNCGSDGEIIPETVYIKDVSDVYKLIVMIIQSDHDPKNEVSLSAKIKAKGEITKANLMMEKAHLNERLDIAYKSVIKRGYYYPLSMFDFFYDLACKVGFYLAFYLQKLRIIK